MTAEQRAEAYRRWLESFGLTDRDWRRIRALAAQATDGRVEPALADLDAPWRVAVCPAAERRWRSGVLLGVIGDQAVLAWPKDGTS